MAKSGSNVNTGHRLLGTPIAVAALRGHFGVIKTLSRHKAEVLRTSLWMGSVLHRACFDGDTGTFKAMMLDVKENKCKWGSDIHRTCISSFLDPMPTDDERSELTQRALLHALPHHMCPAESIVLLRKHVRKLKSYLCWE